MSEKKNPSRPWIFFFFFFVLRLSHLAEKICKTKNKKTLASVNKILIAAKHSFPIWLLIGWLKRSILLYSAKTVTFGHSRSCDEVTLVRLQVNPPVRTAGPVMFHNDCNLFLNAYINHNVHAKHSKKIEFYIVPLAYSVFFYVHVVLTPTKMKKPTTSTLCA